jgi:hypothetical protein
MEHRARSFTWARALIAAIRLAREEDWRNTPRIVSPISDSINMAKRIYDRMKDEFPNIAR